MKYGRETFIHEYNEKYPKLIFFSLPDWTAGVTLFVIGCHHKRLRIQLDHFPAFWAKSSLKSRRIIPLIIREIETWRPGPNITFNIVELFLTPRTILPFTHPSVFHGMGWTDSVSIMISVTAVSRISEQLIRICVVANNSIAAWCTSKSASLAAETTVRIYDIIRRVLADSGTFGIVGKWNDWEGQGAHLDQEDFPFGISCKDLCVSATPKIASIHRWWKVIYLFLMLARTIPDLLTSTTLLRGWVGADRARTSVHDAFDGGTGLWGYATNGSRHLYGQSTLESSSCNWLCTEWPLSSVRPKFPTLHNYIC